MIASVSYHDLFDYPLSLEEALMWRTSALIFPKNKVNFKNYFYLKGREKLLLERERRGLDSEKKIELAFEASKVLSILPAVLFVGVTGSLAMRNSKKDSDIDLIVEIGRAHV